MKEDILEYVKLGLLITAIYAVGFLIRYIIVTSDIPVLVKLMLI